MYAYVIRTRDTRTIWDIITSDVREPKEAILESWFAYRREYTSSTREPDDRFEISLESISDIGLLRRLTKYRTDAAAKSVPA